MPRWLRGLLIGVLVCLAVVLGLYLGVWLMFIGGIVQVAEALKNSPIDALSVGIGIVRVLGAGFVGWLTFIVISFVTYLFAKVTE